MSDFFAAGTPANVGKVLLEIERQKASRRDYIYPAAKLCMRDDGTLNLGATDCFQVVGLPNDSANGRVYTEWADAEKALDEAIALGVESPRLLHLGKGGCLPLKPTAERQLSEKLGIPLKYAQDLRARKCGDLASYNYSTLMHRHGDTMMLRCLDGSVRAVLSPKYRIMDNSDVFFAAAQAMQEAGAKIWQARLWDDRFEMLAVSPSLHAEVERQFKDDGGTHRLANVEGKPDVINAAVKITNSETGCGGGNVLLASLRQACNNTSIYGKLLKSIHLGGRQEEGGIQYADDTQESAARTTWLKLRDAIKLAFDPIKFQEMISQLNGIAREPLANAEKVVAAVAEHFSITEDRRASILQSLFEGRDLTRYGLVQAITAQAHVTDGAVASDLEALGGEVAEMSVKEFAAILA
jgi:hypothetical protein